MDVYILDDQLRRTEVVDLFESLIWKERWNDLGDFELKLQSDQYNRKLFELGNMIAITPSKRVMLIENAEDTDDSEGRPILKISGRSLEACLSWRGASITYGPASFTPGGWVREYFNVQYRGVVGLEHLKMPFIKPGSIYPATSLPESTDTTYVPTGLDDKDTPDLLSITQEITQAYDMGFRLVRNGDLSELYFDVYTGDDRTSSQTARPAVIFSPKLDNIKSTTYVESNQNTFNRVSVGGPTKFVTVYDNGGSASDTGFQIRQAYLNFSNYDFEGQPWLDEETELRREGYDFLAKHRQIAALDGELTENNEYIYDTDYRLGDLVELRNADGVSNKMRVTEQIFVSDAEGDRAYPTLSSNIIVQPGTWQAYEWNIPWDDAVGTWNDAAV